MEWCTVCLMIIILQWNARSLISNGQEFKKYISDLEDRPHIICIQETWLKPQLDFIIQGYTAIRNDRKDRQGGGVATFVQDGLRYKVENMGQEYESVVVKIWIGNDQVSVVNFYNPSKRLSIEDLGAVSGQSQGKIVWCGDFNSYNVLWGSLNTDANGVIIEEFLELNSLVCINDGRGTRYDCCRNTESYLDLTFISSGMAGITSWEVLSELPMGSDHFPIIVTVGIDVIKEDEVRVPRWRLDKANWELFQVLAERKCGELDERCLKDVELFNSEFVSNILQVAEVSIPKTGGRGVKKSVPWWNEQCSAAIKQRSGGKCTLSWSANRQLNSKRRRRRRRYAFILTSVQKS
ncbi:uncharacterized protein LOC132144830 [Carassius carassius]|uniref:uncharacterized protein LOC132144830 n=1 Tax=Carassius carassius TaxID=217509 RepID=UPI0028684E08|nr:uncharacterized protein LOC132144830 [Carassius carassius]